MPAATQSLRRAAFDRFSTLGFPTTRNEDWHYTSPAAIADHDFALLTARSGDVRADALAPFTFGATDWHTLVVREWPVHARAVDRAARCRPA